MISEELKKRLEHAELRRILFRGWWTSGCWNLGKFDYEEGDIAVRLISTKERVYDCWIPDPDDEECSVHLVIDELELIKRVLNSGNASEFSKKCGCFLTEFRDMEMPEKIACICKAYDILEFLGLEDIPEGTPADEVLLEKNLTSDAIKVEYLL